MRGYLDGGLASAASRPDLIAETTRVSPERAAELLAANPELQAVDVRTAGERAAVAIEGSVHAQLPRLSEHLRDVPRDTPLLVFCAGGYRSSTAASLLHREGFTRVVEMAGGIAAWETGGLPVRAG